MSLPSANDETIFLPLTNDETISSLNEQENHIYKKMISLSPNERKTISPLMNEKPYLP